MPIKHAFTSGKADGGDSTLVRPSDWNADHVIDTDEEFIGTISPYSSGISIATALVANTGYFIKIVPRSDVTVSTAHFRIQTTGGNMDIGIYDASGARLGSTGSFATPASGAATRALTSSVPLSANTAYYIAMATSSTTMRIALQTQAVSTVLNHGWNLRGTQASVLPLPTSVTPTWDASSTIPAPVIILI